MGLENTRQLLTATDENWIDKNESKMWSTAWEKMTDEYRRRRGDGWWGKGGGRGVRGEEGRGGQRRAVREREGERGR